MTTLEVKGTKVIEKTKKGKIVSEHDLSRVLGGYKATLSNERTSEEAKEHARIKIEELERSSKGVTQEHKDEHTRRVIGGLKAALKNEHVSEEKKEEIRGRLEEMGEEFDS